VIVQRRELGGESNGPISGVPHPSSVVVYSIGLNERSHNGRDWTR
jgi:hypothetical protein